MTKKRSRLALNLMKTKKKVILKFNYIPFVSPEIHTYGISSKKTQVPNKKKKKNTTFLSCLKERKHNTCES